MTADGVSKPRPRDRTTNTGNLHVQWQHVKYDLGTGGQLHGLCSGSLSSAHTQGCTMPGTGTGPDTRTQTLHATTVGDNRFCTRRIPWQVCNHMACVYPSAYHDIIPRISRIELNRHHITLWNMNKNQNMQVNSWQKAWQVKHYWGCGVFLSSTIYKHITPTRTCSPAYFVHVQACIDCVRSHGHINKKLTFTMGYQTQMEQMQGGSSKKCTP